MRVIPVLLALLLVSFLSVACSGGDESASTAAAESGGANATGTATEMSIETLREGTGRSPRATDTVQVHYHGTFPGGGVFDSSVERGQPAIFPLNRVIPCWTQAVQTMKVGGKMRVTCPPHLAYGERGAGPIPPDATLVFEVELLAIQ